MSRLLGLMLVALGVAGSALGGEPAKIVLVAGKPSHGPGQHEFNAGVTLLAKCLKEASLGVEPVIVRGGWPEDESVFEGASSLVFFMDGGGGHPMIQGERLKLLQKYMDKGVGMACLHYAVEVPAQKGGEELTRWIGGFYDRGYSINPHWLAAVERLPDHAITRGVRPFTIEDEWYFNMRFRPEMEGVTAIVVASPDNATRERVGKGEYAHIAEAKGRPEVLAWAAERPDGGRGFGFTGAHFHQNWADENVRKLVLNAIVWTAKLEVPSDGVTSQVTATQMQQDLDPKPRGQ